MPMYKYAWHITHVSPTALILYSTYRPHITAYTNKKTATFIYHSIAIHVLSTNMPLKCHRYATYTNYFMCTYETTMLVYIPQMSQCKYSAIHTFHIIGICHEHICLSHCTSMSHCTSNFSLHIDPYISAYKLQHLFNKLLLNMCQQEICHSMPKTCHMPKLLDVHLWGKYGNICQISSYSHN